MVLPDGRTLGVIRQGATTDRTAFSDRVRWLPDPNQPMPRALLGLMPDEARLRQSRRLLARYPGPVFLAQEEHVANASADDRGMASHGHARRPIPERGPGPHETGRSAAH